MLIESLIYDMQSARQGWESYFPLAVTASGMMAALELWNMSHLEQMDHSIISE
jgi:hypothetical protein